MDQTDQDLRLELEERLRFETLMADLSAHFVNLQADQVDAAIEKAQRLLCEGLGLDRSSLWQRSLEDPEGFLLTHLFQPAGSLPARKPGEAGLPLPSEWLIHRREGSPSYMRMEAKSFFPWVMRQVQRGETVVIPRVDDLPPEAAHDQEMFRQYGTVSTVVVPLTMAGAWLGGLTFASMREGRSYSEALVKRFRFIADLFSNALDRQRADLALRESEERMTLAAEAAGFGVWVWNLARNRVWGSESWRGLFGFVPGQDVSFEEVIQRIHPDDRELVKRGVQRAMEEGGDYVGELRVVLPDGTQRWISARGRARADANGKPARMMGAAVDITETKRAEAETLGLRLQLWHVDRVAQTGAITASLAHELNQPLTGILSTAQAGLRFTASGNADCALIRELLTNIVHDTKRAGGVINGLRTMLRRKETRREPIDLAATIREVLDLVHSELIGRQVQASQNLEPDLTVVADKGQIQQVLLNLLMNALEAMQDQPDEARRLKLTLTRTETGEALVSLRDSGPGVPEGGQEKLFEAFWTTKKEGMGIGLAVSRSIIEFHGGRLWFANNPDRGATFYFSLPVPRPSDSQAFRKEATAYGE